MILLAIDGIKKTAQYRPAGYVEEVLSHGSVREDGFVEFTQEAFDSLVAKYSPGTTRSATAAPRGPGTELKALLATIGITATPNCSCNSRAAIMDAEGCDWCEANIDTIVGWLREEATKRGLPFLDAAGRLLVRRAIRNARRAAG
jgi:hypothetical protein